jgi:hypothetical protein
MGTGNGFEGLEVGDDRLHVAGRGLGELDVDEAGAGGDLHVGAHTE